MCVICFKWTLISWHKIKLKVTTQVNRVPWTNETFDNVACVDTTICATEPVPPVHVTGKLETKKEVIIPGNKIVTKTWELVRWKITVKAVWGDVEMKWIKDTIPEHLEYSGYSVEGKPDWITINSPTIGNGFIGWKVTWTLMSWEKIVLLLDTKVVKLPKKGETIKNEVCAIPTTWDQCCTTWQTTSLRIKKYILDKNGNKKSSITWHAGDDITYLIEFGNKGDVGTFVSLKDFLPKWISVESSTLVVNRTYEWDVYEWWWEVLYQWAETGVQWVNINYYTWVYLWVGNRWQLIIKWKTLQSEDNQFNRTNFACIYDQSGKRIDCDDAVYNIWWGVLCESDIRAQAKTLCNWDSWTVPVTCNSNWGTADKIEILCDNVVQASWTNISELKWTCTFSSEGSHKVQCKVNDGVAAVSWSNCKWLYTLNYKECWWGRSCFPAWTKIIMADGTSKNIEDVEEWDAVLSYNTDTNTNEPNIVNRQIVHKDSLHEMYELTINGNVLKVTDVHPFYVRKTDSSKDYDWIEAKNLKVWDNLLMTDGSLVKIEKIKHYNNQETVYNLEVDNNHDYFVDKWYLVHNKPTPHPDPDTPDSAEPQECFNVNAWQFSIEEWEIFPFYWNMSNMNEVYRNTNNYTHISNSQASYNQAEHNYSYESWHNCDSIQEGKIAKDSMVCTFKIYNGWDNAKRYVDWAVYDNPLYTIEWPCLSKENYISNTPIIRKWYDTMTERYCSEDPEDCYFYYGEDGGNIVLPTAVYYIENFWSGARIYKNVGGGERSLAGHLDGERKAYWEYMLELSEVKYLQCLSDDGEHFKWRKVELSSEKQNEYKLAACQNNFVLTNSYTVQKTPSWNLRASTEKLSKYYSITGLSFDSRLNAIETTEYTPNAKVESAMDAFIKKYEKLAVNVNTNKFWNSITVKKVPWKDIYFISWNANFKASAVSKPFTIVQTNGDSTISGNSSNNMMLLTKGNITFKWNCTGDQNVKWIFYAQRKLIRDWVEKNNDIEHDYWCTNGWLHVKWVLIWKGFNELMEKSRSNLNDWFDINNNEARRRNLIMNWASVVIEYSPSIFTKSTMPPGAEDFTTALSIYKQ